jgi:hypothetical protein
MTQRSTFLSRIASYLWYSIAIAVFGLTWGCGASAPSQSTPDEAANARAQAVADRQKQASAKKRLPDVSVFKEQQRPRRKRD